VTVNAYGSEESCEVEGATIPDALEEAMRELGYDGNDEGSLTIKISGAAG
jgi:hypothetical protein